MAYKFNLLRQLQLIDTGYLSPGLRSRLRLCWSSTNIVECYQWGPQWTEVMQLPGTRHTPTTLGHEECRSNMGTYSYKTEFPHWGFPVIQIETSRRRIRRGEGRKQTSVYPARSQPGVQQGARYQTQKMFTINPQSIHLQEIPVQDNNLYGCHILNHKTQLGNCFSY